MSTIVVMPGGFHPFHAGHAALYNSARRAFPGADVYVAATNDTSTRPFPFAIKEKLAKLAGVAPGHFVQVKSPFRAREITDKFNPEQDKLIFVRSQKDATKPPEPGRFKKDGTPGYLQPLLGAKKLEPFGQHAYMAYLPTVEFGPGMTSATEIRTAWPTLNEKRKTALVMSLYPKTQTNPKLAATVVKMLDTAMGGEELNEAQSVAQPGQLVTIIQAPRILDLLPGETFEVRTSDPEGVTLKHGMGTKFDNVKFPHGTYKIAKAQGLKEFAPDGFNGDGGEDKVWGIYHPLNKKFMAQKGQRTSFDTQDQAEAWLKSSGRGKQGFITIPIDLDEGFFGLGGPAVGAPLASTSEYNRLGGASKLRHDAHVALKMVDSLKHTNRDGYYDEEIKKYLKQAQEYLAKAKELEQGQQLDEFAPDEGGGGRKFIPWPEFIDAVKQIVGKDFSVTEKVVKSTIQDRFIPHDPMEYGPTMLYSYYEARAGRNKGAVSTRGSIQVGKYYPNNTALGTRNFITSFNLLKGHPFERHFDLTFDNVYKIANIIMGNTEGAYQMQQGVAEGEGDPEGLPHMTPELVSHIVDQIDTEGPHAIVKSITWGDGASEELTQFIKQALEDYAEQGIDENQGWAATYTNEAECQTAGTPAVGGMTASYQKRENQPPMEDYANEKRL